MPGFGSDPFGNSPFGHWDWQRRVFYKSLPVIYREEDPENGLILKKFSEGFGASFTGIRHGIRNFPLLRDPEKVRSQYQNFFEYRLGKVVEPEVIPEQRGVFGQISLAREFVDPSARFTSDDLGKVLRISGSQIQSNNREVRIASVISSTEVATFPLLLEDDGPLRWEMLPKIPRRLDEMEIEVQFGDLDDVRPGWILSDGRADYEILARNHFRSDYDDVSQKPLDRSGSDGAITSTGEFSSGVARFTQRDVGKVLTILDSNIPENNLALRIETVLSDSLVELDGELQADAGPLEWAIRKTPTVTLRTRSIPRGVVEQAGVSLQVDPLDGSIVRDEPAGSFTALDEGKLLLIRGSSEGNDGIYKVTEHLSGTRVRLDEVLAPESDLTWELRTESAYSNTLVVTIRPPSLLRRLARDFGIEVDTTESEFLQRSWVRNVTQWIGIKGSRKSYEVVALLSDFEADPQPLYRIDAIIYPSLPPQNVFVLGDSDPGRSGSDGSFVAVGGEAGFTSPTASFIPTDVGRAVRVQGSGSGNDGFYSIIGVINASTAIFRPEHSPFIPDSNDGSLEWGIVRLYSNLPPTRPRFDDLDTEMMEEYVEALADLESSDKKFRIDKYCWEPDFYASMGVSLIDAVEIAPRTWEVTVEDVEVNPGDYPGVVGSAAVVQDYTRWRFIDGAGQEMFLESEPVEVPGSTPRAFTFNVSLPFEPQSGPDEPRIKYVCPETTSCSFCRSNKIRLLIQEGEGAQYEDNREAAFQRVLRRVEDVTPAHVQVFPVLFTEFEAELNLEAAINPDIWLYDSEAAFDLTFDSPLTEEGSLGGIFRVDSRTLASEVESAEEIPLYGVSSLEAEGELG